MNRCFQRPGLSLCLCRLQSPVALSHHRKRPEELPQLLPPTHHSTHSRFTDFTASLCLRTISGPLYPRPWRRPSCITRVVKLNSRSDERQTRNQCVWSLEFEVGVWICWLPFAACRVAVWRLEQKASRVTRQRQKRDPQGRRLHLPPQAACLEP